MGLLATVAQTYVYTTTTTSSSSGAMWFLWLLYVAVLVLMIVGMWKLFEKAGEAGWKSIVPFYNTYTMFRIAGRNGWGFLLMLIPLVNIIVFFMVAIDLAKHFGKSAAWGVFLLGFFPFIGYLILGFGDDQYVGTKHA